jgi:hypothetical protein
LVPKLRFSCLHRRGFSHCWLTNVRYGRSFLTKRALVTRDKKCMRCWYYHCCKCYDANVAVLQKKTSCAGSLKLKKPFGHLRQQQGHSRQLQRAATRLSAEGALVCLSLRLKRFAKWKTGRNESELSAICAKAQHSELSCSLHASQVSQ